MRDYVNGRNTSTMPTPKRILPDAHPVRLTAKLDEAQQLQLYHLGTPLAQHDDGLEIVITNAPATIELTDFQDATGGQWTLTATSAGSPTWNRDTGLCRSLWGETPAEVCVTVTATNGTSAAKTRPIFIRVKPEGSMPWP